MLRGERARMRKGLARGRSVVVGRREGAQRAARVHDDRGRHRAAALQEGQQG